MIKIHDIIINNKGDLFMGVKVAKYITLSERCTEYGDDGYFIEPHIIEMMLFDELKLKNVEEFVNETSITITENEISDFLQKHIEKMKDMFTDSKYYFEPYSLQYFKRYTTILKEKCRTLCSVLNDINRCKTEVLSEEAQQRFKDLDFHI